MVLKLQKSACGLSLRDGSLSIAFAFMVGMCSGLVGYIAYLKGRLYDYLLTEEECFFLYLEITILVVLLIFNMLLVIGVVLENAGILLAWVIAHALYAFFLISKFTTSFYDAVVTVELLYCVGVLVFYLTILWLVLYSVMVVYSYRALIQAAAGCACLEEEKLRLRDYDDTEEDQRGGKRLSLDSRMYNEQQESPVQSLIKSAGRRFTAPSPRRSTVPPPQHPPPQPKPSEFDTLSPPPPPPPPATPTAAAASAGPTGSFSSQQQHYQQQQQQQPMPSMMQMTWKKQTIAPSTPSLAPDASGIHSYQFLQPCGQGIPSTPTISHVGMVVPVTYSRDLDPAQLLSAAPTRRRSQTGPYQGNEPFWRLALMNPSPVCPPPLVRAQTSPMTSQTKPWKQQQQHQQPPMTTTTTMSTITSKKQQQQQQLLESPPHLRRLASDDSEQQRPLPLPLPSTTSTTSSRLQPKMPRKCRLARDASRLSARSSDLKDMAPHSGSKKSPQSRGSPAPASRKSSEGGSGQLQHQSQTSGQARTVSGAAPTSGSRVAVSTRPALTAGPLLAGPYGGDADLGSRRSWRTRNERAKQRRSPLRK